MIHLLSFPSIYCGNCQFPQKFLFNSFYNYLVQHILVNYSLTIGIREIIWKKLTRKNENKKVKKKSLIIVNFERLLWLRLWLMTFNLHSHHHDNFYDLNLLNNSCLKITSSLVVNSWNINCFTKHQTIVTFIYSSTPTHPKTCAEKFENLSFMWVEIYWRNSKKDF